MEVNSMTVTTLAGTRHVVHGAPKRWLLGVQALVLLLFVVGFLAACRNQPQPLRITYAMPVTVAAIPAYVALERGYWAEQGLEVDARMFSAGRLALDALLAKNAQVMSVSETPLVHAILQGNKIFIVATVTAHKEAKLIVRTDHGIRGPADLRGKKIATLPGTNSDFLMYRFLEVNGISPRDVKITNMAPPEMVTALVGGDIDAYFAWEPHIYYARERLPVSTAVYPPGNLYAGRHCVAMNQDFVAQHPEVVTKLIRGFIQAERYVAEHPAEARAIVAKRTGMDDAALRGLWPEYRVAVQFDRGFVGILDDEAQWVRRVQGTAEPIPRMQDFVYTAALREVRPASVSIGQ
jgi:ABC-type nitrate/sulfonate/bicarbonate transport system substrate-binding protein